MRQLLFRAKRATGNGWVEGLPYYNLFGQLCIQPFDDTCCVVIDEDTLGQYTTLIDHEGRKIFEGDIVEEIDESVLREYFNRWVVHWEEDSCGFEPFSDSVRNCGHCGGGIYPDHIKVIGNIHDNPEIFPLEVVKT